MEEMYQDHFSGFARWAEENEIKTCTTQIDLRQSYYPACGIPLIVDQNAAFVADNDSHCLVIGSSGSKKSRSVAMPYLEIIARAGHSVVVSDPKGELYEKTSGVFAQKGYSVYVINLREPYRSNGVNLIALAAELYESGMQEEAYGLIADLAQTLFPAEDNTSDRFWLHTSRALFRGLCAMIVEQPLLFPKEMRNWWTLRALAESLDSEEGYKTGVTTNMLAAEYPPESQARMDLSNATHGSDKTFFNVLASFTAGLQAIYSKPSLTNMLSVVESIDFEQIGLRPTVVFFILPDEKSTYHFIVSTLIKVVYEALLRCAHRFPNVRLPTPVHFVLDEVGNLPRIPDLCSNMITASRSRGINFTLLTQGLRQLEATYGASMVDTLRGNCNIWLYLHSRELPLLNELSELCGKRKNGQALISPTQLQTLQVGQALVLSGRLHPFVTQLPDIDDYPFERLPAMPLPCLPLKKPPTVDLGDLLSKMKQLKQVAASHPAEVNQTPLQDELASLLENRLEIFWGLPKGARKRKKPQESKRGCTEGRC